MQHAKGAPLNQSPLLDRHPTTASLVRAPKAQTWTSSSAQATSYLSAIREDTIHHHRVRARSPPRPTPGAEAAPPRAKTSAPPMARPRSLPSSIGLGVGLPPQSQSREPQSRERQPSPHRTSPAFHSTTGPMNNSSARRSPKDIHDFDTIAEDAELTLPHRSAPRTPAQYPSTTPPTTHRLPSSVRRRPHSPLLHRPPSPRTPSIASSRSASSSSSPSRSPTVRASVRFNEPCPTTTGGPHFPYYLTCSGASTLTINPSTYAGSSTSSIPSTPTSLHSRSRSPSISSLETIADTPDAEEQQALQEAEEAACIARLKAQAEDEEERGAGPVRAGEGLWGRGPRRKRWSVCGAERRGDLEMETIWEV